MNTRSRAIIGAGGIDLIMTGPGNKPLALIASLACLAVAPSPQETSAHHSIGGEFDSSRQITVEGTVKEYQLINPHTYIVISVDGGDADEEWTLTYGPATKLIRGFGWTPETLHSGDRVRATGRPARKGLGIYLSELTRVDGTVLLNGLVE